MLAVTAISVLTALPRGQLLSCGKITYLLQNVEPHSKRWTLKRPVVLCLTSLALVSSLVAQQTSHTRDSTPASATKKHVFVDGKPIANNRVIVKDGLAYVDPVALAQALGASVQSQEGGVMISSPAPPSCECDKPVVEGQVISEQFRRDVARIPDEIEGLRALVPRKDKAALGPKFDAIDKKLSDAATLHAQRDKADMAVYYALTYANNSLAIAYYKESRGVPAEEAQKDQIDAIMCTMESKFALMKGVLMPGNTCSVFKRMEAQLPLKPLESPDQQ